MVWQTKVAAWVVPLMQQFLVPDDATVVSGVGFGAVDDAEGGVTSTDSTFTASFPGLVPNFSVSPTVVPTVGGALYDIKAKKAIGFHGALTTVLSFDETKFNNWVFPITRRNFGFIALSRGNIVSLSQSIIYQEQVHLDGNVFGLAANYDEQLSASALLNSVDKTALTKASVFQYPTARTRVSFLPIWEEWTVRFFRAEADVCGGTTSIPVPGGLVPGTAPPPPWSRGTVASSRSGGNYVLICTPDRGFRWESLGFE